MNDDTLLIRQVHPSFIQNERVSSQVFKPTAKDGHSELSVYDGDLISAEESIKHYQDELCQQTYGALAVSFSECGSQDLEVTPDPEPFPEHAVIDFGEAGSSKIKKIGKKLRSFAEQRGWQALSA